MRMLKKNKVEYLTEPRDGADVKTCRVMIQKETPDGMLDGPCDEESPAGYAGYCRTHYIEYLCGLVIKEKLEVVSLMELGEVKAIFTRAGKFIPVQRPGEYEFRYLRRLAQVTYHYGNIMHKYIYILTVTTLKSSIVLWSLSCIGDTLVRNLLTTGIQF